MLSNPASPGSRRRYGDGHDRRHGAKASRTGTGKQEKPSFIWRSTTCPGALVYTDENLDVVFATTASGRCIRSPPICSGPAAPIQSSCAHLATHGYYGKGDAEAQVARRVESLRNPTGKSFEDITPDGRCYRVQRRRAADGGTVTVMTDVTDQKLAAACAHGSQATPGASKCERHREKPDA